MHSGRPPRGDSFHRAGEKGNPSWLLPSGETGVIHTYQQTIQNTDGGNGRWCCCGLSYSILDISNCISRQSAFPSRGLWHFKYYCHVLGPIIYIQLSNLYVQLSNIDNSGVFAYPMDAIQVVGSGGSAVSMSCRPSDCGRIVFIGQW